MFAFAENPYERFLRAIHKTVFLVDRRADRLLHEHFSTRFSQFLVLTAIVKCAGDSQQKIAEFLNLTPAAISRQIDALVATGLIERLVDPKSRRAHVVRPTNVGKEKHQAMKSLLTKEFKDTISTSATELDSASEMMERFVNALYPPGAEHKQ